MTTTVIDFEAARQRMVARQLAARGIRDPLVLAAMGKVPRERFVSGRQAPFAYEDEALPIGEGQTISQPYIVARMTEAAGLSHTNRVLEIGTGTGYSAAVLAEIVAEVYTVERLAGLADAARQRLAGLGYGRVHVRTGDGTLGWPEHSPYDAILVTASGPEVPPTLLGQLALGGRLVMPLGSHDYQCLLRIVRAGPDDYPRQELEAVVFVPLIGAHGWPEREAP